MGEHWSAILAGPQRREAERASQVGSVSTPTSPIGTANALSQYGSFLKDHWSTILKDPAQGFSNALQNTFSMYPSDRGVNALNEYLRTGAIPEDLPQVDMNQLGSESLDLVFPIAGMVKKVGSRAIAPGHLVEQISERKAKERTGMVGDELPPPQPQPQATPTGLGLQAGGDPEEYQNILNSLRDLEPDQLPEANLLRLQAGGDEVGELREYPMAPKGEWYSDEDYLQRGGEIVKMSPDDFLALGKPLQIDDVARDNIDDLKNHMLEGRTLDPLSYYGGEGVRGTDGRHRAIAAKELGIDIVPVVNLSGKKIKR